MNRSALRYFIALWALVAVSSAACTATPLPEPPSASPPDVDGAHLTSATTTSMEEVNTPIGITMQAPAGSATAGAVVGVINLDDARPRAVTTSARDGSFLLSFAARPNDELRFYSELAGMRSLPVDRRWVHGQLVAPMRPPCLRTDPELQVAVLAPATSVVVLNACAAPIELVSVTRRTSAGAFAVEPVTPATIEVGRSVTLMIALEASATAEDEDVAFVNTLIEGVAVRYPLTLRVGPRP